MYQIVLTENKVKIKVLHTYSREHDALYRFNKIGSSEIFMPKQTVYKEKSLTDVSYEVLLLKEYEEGDLNVSIKDDYGRKIQILTDDGAWTVMGKVDYDIEEQFNVTGANRKLNGKEILDHVLLNNVTDKNPKQVVILNNKVVIEGINIFMVTCKNVTEATRLYNKLRVHCYDNSVGGVIFFGTVPKPNKKLWYKKIHGRTGTSYNRLYRSTSR
tara:strand:+ start:2807 stop:3448 length:642 start_codon:yes stop_codon:yes gene_type:complete